MMWVQGSLIQDAFPNMDPAARELLISGVCCLDTVADE